MIPNSYFFFLSAILAALAASGAYLAALDTTRLRSDSVVPCPLRRNADNADFLSKIGKRSPLKVAVFSLTDLLVILVCFYATTWGSFTCHFNTSS